MTIRKRYDFISDIKTAIILGVVLTHCMLFYADNPFFPESAGFSSPAVTFLCGIVDASLMPGMVFCSGFLYAAGLWRRERTIAQSIAERARRLLIPYYIYGAVWVVPLYTFFDINAYGRPEGAGYLSGYKYMLLGSFADHLWFLWMLFWVSLAFILMKPLLMRKRYFIVSVLTTALAFAVEFLLAGFPYFKLSQIAPYLLCFCLGVLLFLLHEKLEHMPVPAMYASAGIMLAVCVVYAVLTNMNFALGWLCKMAGALMLYFLFMALERIGVSGRVRRTRFWEYTQKHSFQIYLLNCPFMYVYFRLLYPWIGENVLLCILVNFVLCMFSIYAAVWLQDRIKGMLKMIGRKRAPYEKR